MSGSYHMAVHLSGGSGCATVLAIVFLPGAIVAYLRHDPKWLAIIPISVVLAALVAALRSKRTVTPQQWAAELEPHLLGTEGKWDWDDATSVRLADPRLEALRLKLARGFDEIPDDERRREFEAIIDALKRGEVPQVKD
jgi:hypothetical protein